MDINNSKKQNEIKNGGSNTKKSKINIMAFIKKLEKEEEEEKKKYILWKKFIETYMAEGVKLGEERGISEGISQVAINMLKQKCKKDLIKQCTGLSDERIKELEKTLQSA